MIQKIWAWIFLVLFLVSSNRSWSQEIPFEVDPQPTPSGKSSPVSKTNENLPGSYADVPTTSNNDIQISNPAPKESERKLKAFRPADLSHLDTLEPFRDVAVISKKFLPRTHRFELSPTLGYILNDAFFTNVVWGGRLGFYFTEQHGIELQGLMFSSSSKSTTDELATERGVGTVSLATPKNYYGAAYKWVPIYGKVGLVNKTIIPFDTYFLVGGGMTGTNQDTSPPTLHLGAGQLYAIKQWCAFRWDFSWFTYQTDSKVQSKPGGTYNNLHISLGFSFYFPGAGYR